MADDNDINRMLGQIDGKLDATLEALNRHIDDDVRRFTDVYGKLDEQAKDINQAKGAKGVVLYLIGGGAAAIGGLVAMAARAFGKGG